MDPTTPSHSGLRRRRGSPSPDSLWSSSPSPESLWSSGLSERRASLPDELPGKDATHAVPLDESSDRTTGAEHSTAANPSAHAQEAGQSRRELERLTAENVALRAALSEEEKRNAELLSLVRRADKEMQDITQRDRDLAARLTKWREEVRNPTAFDYTAAKRSLTQHCCSTAC